MVSTHPNMLYTVSDRDLAHVEHLSILDSFRCSRAAVKVDCHFQAGDWNALFQVSEALWEKICKGNGLRGFPSPRGLHRLSSFDRNMRREGTFGELIAMDPRVGSGFIAHDLYIALGDVEWRILSGPWRGRWEAL